MFHIPQWYGGSGMEVGGNTENPYFHRATVPGPDVTSYPKLNLT